MRNSNEKRRPKDVNKMNNRLLNELLEILSEQSHKMEVIKERISKLEYFVNITLIDEFYS